MTHREISDNWKVEMELIVSRVEALEALALSGLQPQLQPQPQQQPQPVSVEAIAGAIATPVGAPPLTVENLGQG
jgi:hypothetical protein